MIEQLLALLNAGQFDHVVALSEDMLKQNVRDARVWRMRALALVNLERYEASVEAFKQALHAEPNDVLTLTQLASVLSALGQGREAEHMLHRAYELDRDNMTALLKLAAVKHENGKADEAAMLLRKLVQRDPNHPIAWQVLGDIALMQRDYSAAMRSFARAAALNPRDARLHYNFAMAAFESGQLTLARDALERALVVDPKLIQAKSQLLYIKRKLADWQHVAQLNAEVQQLVALEVPGVLPFAFLSETDDSALQLKSARTFALQIERKIRGWPRPRVLGAGSKLKLGFISNGFGQHPTGLLTVEFLERLKGEDVEVELFCTGHHEPGPIRTRLLNRWPVIEIGSFAPQRAAQRVSESALSVLFDLRGFGGGATPELLALRPAAKQFAWMAYPATSGAPWLDGYLADAVVLPERLSPHFSEKVYRLPGYFQSMDCTREVAVLPRRELGLPEGRLIASLNNGYKYTEPMVNLWAELLKHVPDVTLCLLRTGEGDVLEANLRRAFVPHGIDMRRLCFLDKCPHETHLARLHQCELFLDTFPYGAHTTASDAVFAACPVLTLTGQSFASRVATSLNAHLGCQSLNTESGEDYLRRGIAVLSQPGATEVFRNHLLRERSSNPIFDMRAFARGFVDTVRRALA
jgi:predicted O-linked N-acetylglucosamine transferase (SPINDLY family)